MRAWRRKENQDAARRQYNEGIDGMVGLLPDRTIRHMRERLEGRFGRMTKLIAEQNKAAAHDPLPPHWERLLNRLEVI